MCRSQAEGGQRCASYAREAVAKAQGDLVTARLERSPRKISAAMMALDVAHAQYASTPEGQKVYAVQQREAEESLDFDLAASLVTTQAQGEKIRAAAKDTRAIVKQRAGRPSLTLIQGGQPSGLAAGTDQEEAFCDWCWTDPGPDGQCDCVPGAR